MSLETTLQDWKHQNNDPLGYWLSKLDENQLKLMDDVKKRFNSHIDQFREIKIEELRDEIEYHISFEAKKQILYKYHSNIINKDSFINHYRSIINIINKDDWGLLNEEMYPEFIYCFGVIGLSSPWVFEENELKALDFLDDVNTLNIIEKLLETLKEDEENQNIHLFKNNIFNDPQGQMFFKYVFEHWLKDNRSFMKVHFVIRWFINKNGIKDEKFGIHATAKIIMKYWNDVYAPRCIHKDKNNLLFNLDIKNPKIYEIGKFEKNNDTWTKELNDLKDEFIRCNKSPQ